MKDSNTDITIIGHSVRPTSSFASDDNAMGIYNVFIVSKSGGLIYHYDHNLPVLETEKTFSYPLDIKLR